MFSLSLLINHSCYESVRCTWAMTLTRYIYISKGTLWKGVYSSGSCRTKGNRKPTTHFPWENQTYPHRDAWCSLSHCKLVFSKLPKVVSINKVIFLCDFICTKKFLPFFLSSLLCMAFEFICEEYLFHFRKSSFGLDVRKVEIYLQFLSSIY